MTIDRWIPQAPFPIDALRPVSSIWDFTTKVSIATQTPHSLTGPAVLSVASAAVQCNADVLAPFGATMGTGLNISVVGGTGVGKTTVLKIATPGFEEFEAGLLSDPIEPYSASTATSGASPSPTHHQILIENATEGGVIDLYASGARSIFYGLDEGAKFFQRLDIPALCKRLDGDTLRFTRKDAAPLIIKDRRAAMCLMIQDVPFERLLKKKGDLLIDSGLLPRTMMSFVESHGLLGCGRFVPGIDELTLRDHVFHSFVRKHLSNYAHALRQPFFTRWKLAGDPLAIDSWHEFVHALDWNVRHEGDLADIRPFVARAGQHCIKLAAVLQGFESDRPTIERWAVDSARQIVAWHLMEAKAAFGRPPIELVIQRNASELLRYLQDRAMRTGTAGVSRGDLQRCGPDATRSADKLDMALNRLQQFGQVRIVVVRGGKQMIQVPVPRWGQSTQNFIGPWLG